MLKRAKRLTKELGYTVEPGFETFVTKAREQNIADGNEWTYIAKSGKRIPVWLTVTCIKNSNSEIIGYLGIAEDYSEKKLAQEEIFTLYKTQHAIANSTNLSIISTYPDGTIQSFNEGAEKMLGYKAEEVVNISSPSIFHDFNEVAVRAEILTKELGYKVEPGFDVFHIKNKFLGILSITHSVPTLNPLELFNGVPA